MRLQIKPGLEDDKFVIQTLPVETRKVISPKVLLQRIIVAVIVRLLRIRPVTDEAALVLSTTMLVEPIIIVEALRAKLAERMALEARLIGPVVAPTHMLIDMGVVKELMLVRKHLFIAGAEIAHALAMGSLDVSMEVGPAEAGKVARGVGAVVAEEQDRITDDVLVAVFDADVCIRRRDVGIRIILEPLLNIVGEDDKGGRRTADGAVHGLVESPHPQPADVTRCMVARCDRMVRDRISTDEAHLGLILTRRQRLRSNGRLQRPSLSSCSSILSRAATSSRCSSRSGS